jgi:hypothetical protein
MKEKRQLAEKPQHFVNGRWEGAGCNFLPRRRKDRNTQQDLTNGTASEMPMMQRALENI